MVLVDQDKGQWPLRSWTARLAVSTIFFANGLVIANWIARIPDVKHRLGLGEGTLGLALLCAAVGALLAQVVTGWAINRTGSRVIMTLMVVLFFATVSLPGFAADLPLLMLALFVLGACNGSLDVAMNAQAALVKQAICPADHGLISRPLECWRLARRAARWAGSIPAHSVGQ